MQKLMTIAMTLVVALTFVPNASAAYTSDAACNPEIPPLLCVTGSINIYPAGSDSPCTAAGDTKGPGEVCKAFVYSGGVSALFPGMSVELDGTGSHGEGVDCTGPTNGLGGFCSASVTSYFFADGSRCADLGLRGTGFLAGVPVLAVNLAIEDAC